MNRDMLMKSLDWLPGQLNLTTSSVDRFKIISAYQCANLNSPDPSTKNGAVLVNENGNILTYGVNRFPINIAETDDRFTDKAIKYKLIVHAENGAIFHAARQGKRVDGSTLYCPFFACCECAKAIIQSGVLRVVGHAQLMALASEHTAWVKSIVVGWAMMDEAGVQCDLYDGEMGIMTRFNGRDVAV